MILEEIHFWLFKNTLKVPKKYFYFVFHLDGSVVFMIGTLKHIKRKNHELIAKHVRGVLWQLKEALYALVTQRN